MIFDLLRNVPGPADVVDVCVVGAGAAGIVLAVELERHGKSVLLLEGGGRGVELAAQEPLGSEVVGHAHSGVHTGRVRAHGGTTTKWGGQILELDRADFEKRDWIPGSGWPFAKETLAPFYAQALRQEGVSGALQKDAEVWRTLGLLEPRFEGLEAYVSRWCPEPNFARLHARVLEGPGVRVWLHANAVGLRMNGERVQAIRCRTQTGTEAEFSAREYVFAMGSIESVRFFLQPRDGGLPWNASGMLGRHFQDHIDADIAEVKPKDWTRFGALFDNIFLKGFKYHPKLRLNVDEQRVAGVLNCAATMAFASEDEEVAAELKSTVKHMLRGRWRELKATDLMAMVTHAPLLLRQTLRYTLAHRAFHPAGTTVRLRAHCEQEPHSASTVALAGERDSLGMLRTRLDWRVSELEIRTMRQYARTAQRALAAVAEVTPREDLMNGHSDFEARCQDSNHHMGGMRMNVSAMRGVVSPDLLLHGTVNCYVCSGAVFPCSGFSNPTHTVLALAMRLAEHLSERLAGPL